MKRLAIIFLVFLSCNEKNSVKIIESNDVLSMKINNLFENLRNKNFEHFFKDFNDDYMIQFNDIKYDSKDKVLSVYKENKSFFEEIKIDSQNITTLKLNEQNSITTHKFKLVFDDFETRVAKQINFLVEYKWKNDKIYHVMLYYDSTLLKNIVKSYQEIHRLN